MNQPVYVVDLARTPFGKFNGGLAGVRPDDLAAAALRGLVDRQPAITEHVDDVFFGNANGAGEENRNVARMAVLLAGLPATPGATVNRLCGSGLEAVIPATARSPRRRVDAVIAGGVESMTRAPWVLPKAERAFPRRNARCTRRALGWRMVNPAMEPEDRIAPRRGRGDAGRPVRHRPRRAGRLRSRQPPEGPVARERLARELVDGPWALNRDETTRPDASVESLGSLKPAFRPDGTVTASNASPLNDGASAVLLAGEGAVTRFGLEPLARIVATGVTALEPRLFGPARSRPRTARWPGSAAASPTWTSSN